MKWIEKAFPTEIKEMLIDADDDVSFEGAEDEDSDEDTSMDD